MKEAALGLTTRQLVQRDVKQFLAEQQGKHLAVYSDMDPEWKNLFIRTEGRNSAQDAGDAFKTLQYRVARNKARDGILNNIRQYASIPRKGGKDIYKNQAEADEKATGRKPCYDPDMYASAVCEARMAVGAIMYRTALASTERQTPGAQNQLTAANDGAMQSAKNRSSLTAQDATEGYNDVVSSSLQQLVEVITTPEFQIFLASLKPKQIKDMTAEVQQSIAMMDPVIEKNYLAFLEEERTAPSVFSIAYQQPELANSFAAASPQQLPSLKQLFSAANINLGGASVVTPVSYIQNGSPIMAQPIAASGAEQ
jgi:hypothetical protein